MPTAVTTSTASTSTAYSSQRKVDRTQTNGVLWSHFWDGTSNTASSMRFAYSTDNGSTWTDASASAFGFAGTGTTYVPNASIFIDLDDNIHVAYKDRHDGFIRYRRGTPNAGRTAWTWSAALAVWSINALDYPDIVAHREGAGWVAHIVASYATTSSGAAYKRVTTDSAGSMSLNASASFAETISAGYSVAAHRYPSIDFHHTGDGKTVAGGTPHLYVGWSAGAAGAGKGIRFRKATYAAGSWTWGTETTVETTTYIADDNHWLNCVFDGTRAIVGGQVTTDGGSQVLRLWEVDAGTLAVSGRVSTGNVAGSAEALVAGSLTYDATGVYLLGRDGTGSDGLRKLNWRKWTRAGSSLGAVTAFDSTGNTRPHVSAKRGYSNQRIEWVYTDGTASPYTVTYDAITLNVAPNAPTLVSPIGDQAVDRAIVQRLDWDFSDPDAGDSQSQGDVRYRPIGAPSWTDVPAAAATSTFWDAPASTFAAGSYEWQVRTYDAAGVVGLYSASGFFTATTAPAEPTITAPVSGGTVSSETTTVQWSTPNQDAYQVRTVADAAGTADTGTVYTDTGIVEGASRSRSVAFPTNDRYEHIQVRIRVGGLWSAWASIRVLVSYTRPAVATLAITTSDAAGSITVAITNPTPGVGEPTVTSHDVYRRESLVGGDGIRVAAELAAGATWTDYRPASGVDYAFKVVSVGDNETTSSTDWIGAATPEPEPVGGAGGYSAGY